MFKGRLYRLAISTYVQHSHELTKAFFLKYEYSRENCNWQYPGIKCIEDLTEILMID